MPLLGAPEQAGELPPQQQRWATSLGAGGPLAATFIHSVDKPVQLCSVSHPPAYQEALSKHAVNEL